MTIPLSTSLNWKFYCDSVVFYLQDFTYPDNVAYPLGGEGNPRFVVIEMHYDNPNLRSGKVLKVD